MTDITINKDAVSPLSIDDIEPGVIFEADDGQLCMRLGTGPADTYVWLASGHVFSMSTAKVTRIARSVNISVEEWR